MCLNGRNTCHSSGNWGRERRFDTHINSFQLNSITIIPFSYFLLEEKNTILLQLLVDSATNSAVFVWVFSVDLHLSPSCRHTTSASLSSHWSSHMEPHCPAWKTSTVPSDTDSPPTSRIGSVTTAAVPTTIQVWIHFLKKGYPWNTLWMHMRTGSSECNFAHLQ